MSTKAWVVRDGKDGVRMLFAAEVAPVPDASGCYDGFENWNNLLWDEYPGEDAYMLRFFPDDLQPGECREIPAPWPEDTFDDVQEVNARSEKA